LKRENPSLYIPPIDNPKRHIKNQDDPELLVRRSILQYFLDSLLKSKELLSNVHVIAFLQSDPRSFKNFKSELPKLTSRMTV